MPTKKNVFTQPELSVEDLTKALHQTSLRLAESNLQLQKSEADRTQMLANLSHDLRSPLSSIRGYTEYLLAFDQVDPEELHLTLEQLLSKIDSMEYLLSQLLSISSMDDSQQELHLVEIDLDEYLQNIFSAYLYNQNFCERNLSFQQQTTHCKLNIDPVLFSRVFDNLFTNALKYSQKGADILLAYEVTDHLVHITLEDTGFGISEEDLPYIFDRTYMVTDSRTPQKDKGCGLGLSIVKAIVEKHQGKIWCESILHKGSIFHIELFQ